METPATEHGIDLEPLRRALGDRLATPADAGWDDARRAWNLAVDQRPAAVAGFASAEDVAAVVGVARASGLRVAPQATGHGAAAIASLAGAILLRTEAMGGASVDPVARTARVEAGASWHSVAVAGAEHGLAGLHGSSGVVGVVGYTLNGGIGWLARRHGLACNSVRAIELVTADGRLRRVDHDHDPDLFWALRGGGGHVGAVTAIEFGLYPVATVYGGMLVWPAEASSEVLHAYRDWAPSTPDELTSTIRFLHLPPLPQVPEALRDRPVLDVGVAFLGDAAEGEELVRALREVAPRIIDTVETMPAADLRTMHGDPELPVPGIGHHALLGELTAEAAEALLAVAGPGSGSPLVGLELRQLGGALARREPGHGALGALEGEYALIGVGVPATPQAGAAVRDHLALIVATMEPWATGGVYPGFTDRPHEPRAAFATDDLARLRDVKRRVDPDDLFLSNHPIAG